MALTTFSPNTLISSSVMNSNLSGLSDGTNDATANSLQTTRDEMLYDCVTSGCVWTGDSLGVNRNASMTAGTACINGKRVTVSVVSARTFTASKDTYIYCDDTGALSYTEVANNAASPAIPANSILIGIIVTGATFITNAGSINQGQPDKILPIASSIPYQHTDSIGNLICNRDPMQKTIGYRQITSTFSGTTNAGNGDDVTGLSAPFIADGLTKIKVEIGGKSVRSSAGAAAVNSIRCVEGTTELASVTQQITTNGYNLNPNLQSALFIPTAGLHTYKANLNQGGAGTQSLDCGATNPAFIRIMRA